MSVRLNIRVDSAQAGKALRIVTHSMTDPVNADTTYILVARPGDLVALSVGTDTRIALDEVDETDAVSQANPPRSGSGTSPSPPPLPTPPRYPLGDGDQPDTPGLGTRPMGPDTPQPPQPAGDASEFAEPSTPAAAPVYDEPAADTAPRNRSRVGSASEEDPIF